MPKKCLKIAAIGCGNRAQVYLNLIAEQTDNFLIVAAADPIIERVSSIKIISNNSDFFGFNSADELLAEPKLADVILIATQDNYHFDPCLKALKKGYDIILEKPMCDNVLDILRLEDEAKKTDCKIIICHVLRYTSFYQKIKQIVQNGRLGKVITLHATEGIEPWHFAHSYVRGHWSIMEKSTPTIVAKCCHDMDIIYWLLNQKCLRISSFGELSFFTRENKELIDEYPMYDKKRYLEPKMKVWLNQVYNKPNDNTNNIKNWLKSSNWGRGVFECDNTAVDHQIVNMEFENGVTASLNMTAFDEGRNYEINGTKASLRAGDFYKEQTGADIIIKDHDTKNVSKIDIVNQNTHSKYGDYHHGGDVGFIRELHSLLMSKDSPLTSVGVSVHSHVMAFAAEQARIEGRVIDMIKFYSSQKSKNNALD